MEKITRGNWVLDPATLVISHRRRDDEIDLRTCRRAGDVLIWLGVVRRHRWANAKELGALVRLFDDVLGFEESLSGSVVSCGARVLALTETRVRQLVNKRRTGSRQLKATA